MKRGAAKSAAAREKPEAAPKPAAEQAAAGEPAAAAAAAKQPQAAAQAKASAPVAAAPATILSAFKLKPVSPLTAAFCGVGLFWLCVLISVWGIWSTPAGLALALARQVNVRGQLLLVPPSKRGLMWHIQDLSAKVAYDLPGFAVGFNLDRARNFAALASISEEGGDGGAIAFRDSFIVFNHSTVSGVINAKDQPRGTYLGAAPVPSRCMGPDTLIFLGTGPEHTAVRRLLLEHIPAFRGSNPSGPLLELDFGADSHLVANGTKHARLLSDGELDGLVRRTLIRSLFKSMFGAPITAEGLEAFVEYSSVGGTCVLGSDLHTMTGGYFLRRLDKIRARIRAAVAAAPVGQTVKAAAAAAVAAGTLPNSSADAASGDAIIRQLADGAAFAGMLGTTHLTTHALMRLRSHPSYYVPLFQADPVAFLHEEARLDPPVTSITGVLAKDTEQAVEPRLGKAVFPAGTPFQVAISTANTDPAVFGGPSHSRGRALTFDPTRPDQGESLSWNGRLTDVAQFVAPRGCPGYRLSMSLARSIVTAFAPDQDSIPKPLSPYGIGSKARLPGEASVPGSAMQGPATSGAAASSAPAPPGPGIMDKLGFLIWLALCLGGIGWLLGKGLGACSLRYTMYLLAQSIVAVGFLTRWEWLFVQGQLLAALAYITLFLTLTHQDDEKTGVAYSYVAIGTWLALSALVTAVTVRVGPVPTLQMVSNLFYSIGASLGIASVAKFYLKTREPAYSGNKDMLQAGLFGVIGGFFGIVDLLLVGIPTYGHFLSRLADSTLYVPFVLVAVTAMDAVYTRADVVMPRRRTIRIGGTCLASTIGLIAVAIGVAWAKMTSGDICAWEPVYPAASSPLRPICTGSPLTTVDTYGRLMHSIIRYYISDVEANTAALEDPLSILEPKYEKSLPRVEVIPGSGWTIPTEDEDAEGDGGWLSSKVHTLLFDHFLRSPNVFPIHDNPETWRNIEEARAALTVAGGHTLPEPVSEWAGVDVTSEEAIVRMVFAGFVGGRLAILSPTAQAADPDGAVYYADFSELAGLEVRPGYERFGATAYFNASQHLVRIRWTERALDVRPGDRHWAHAKWVWRCSAVMGITAVEHLLQNHLIYSNLAALAARETLPKDHPVRRVLKPFNHRTPSVNLGAFRFLTTEYSLLHRAVSLTWNGLRGAFMLALKTVRFHGNPMDAHAAQLEALGGDGFPYAQDGSDFFRVVHDFVEQYINIYYADDDSVRNDVELEQMWRAIRVFGDSSGLPAWPAVGKKDIVNIGAGYVYHVTGVHHVVGNVAEYLLSPDFSSPRIRPGAEVADVEGSMYGLLIAVLTGAKAPKLMGPTDSKTSPFEHLLLKDQHLEATTAVFRGFQANLTALADIIDQRNAVRTRPFYGFQPRRMLSSVSI